jgi:hypothetical protein
MIGPSESRLHKWQLKMIEKFDRWFTSPACVWQTLIVCVLIVVVELSFPSLDPHYFILLFILTVYSAVTQPALAQSGASTIQRLETIMERQQEVINSLLKLQEEQVEELEETSEILEDVHELLRRQEP